jgi:hypothetical protein
VGLVLVPLLPSSFPLLSPARWNESEYSKKARGLVERCFDKTQAKISILFSRNKTVPFEIFLVKIGKKKKEVCLKKNEVASKIFPCLRFVTPPSSQPKNNHSLNINTMLRKVVLALALSLGYAGEFAAPSVQMNLKHDK